MSDLFLCVDCGGTKTAAVIADASGAVVGRGSGGPSNIAYLSVELFIFSVKEAVCAALKAATSSSSSPTSSGLSTPSSESLSTGATAALLPPSGPSPFTAAWFGISGADSPSLIAKASGELSHLLGLPPGPRLTVANDTHLLAAPLHALSDVAHAVAVIAGTGSITVSFCRKEDGAGGIAELGRVGGWGWILGDEGGGYDVGREVLRQMLMAQDRASVSRVPRVQSVLIDRVLERFKVQEVMDIFGGVYMSDPPHGAFVPPAQVNAMPNLPREKRLSSLAPLVFEAAFKDNDTFALNVLKTSARNLAAEVAVLLGEGKDVSARTIDAANSVISFGGSLVGVDAYRNLILEDLASRGITFRHVVYVGDAAATGAIGLAAAFKPKALS